MSNKLTLQINSLEALERLIGGDTKTEMDIRNSVVQKFAEKHLKPLANSSVIGKTIESIKLQIETEVGDKCNKEFATFKKNWNGNLHNIELHDDIKLRIENIARIKIGDIVHKAVEDGIKSWTETGSLEEIISKQVQHYTTKHIEEEVDRRLHKIRRSL